MPKTKVTSKFQVTIPKEVREKVKVKPGEIVSIESLSEEEIIIRRFRRLKEPLKVLIGKKTSDRHIPIEELEEKAEQDKAWRFTSSIATSFSMQKF